MIKISYDASIANVMMSRPPVNAIDPAFVTAFSDVLDDVERTKPAAIVIRSDQKCFSAGADLGIIKEFFTAPGGTDAMVAYVKTLHDWFNRLERMPCVTIAAINGPALGGGLELALACDLRIATMGAKLGLPEARVGMIPGAGGTQRLPRLCGPGVANRLILGGEIIDGAMAERLGLVQWTVTGGLDAKIDELTKRITQLSRPALVAAKHCLAAAFDVSIDGFARELEKPYELMQSADTRERISQFFNS